MARVAPTAELLPPRNGGRNDDGVRTDSFGSSAVRLLVHRKRKNSLASDHMAGVCQAMRNTRSTR